MQWKSNHQPLHSEMGTSPLYPGSLGLSKTNATCIPNLMMKEPSEKHTVEPKPCRMHAFICNKLYGEPYTYEKISTIGALPIALETTSGLDDLENLW